MSAISIHRQSLPVIDRAAIRIGTTLVAWARERAASRIAADRAQRYRADYSERARDTTAIVRQGMLP